MKIEYHNYGPISLGLGSLEHIAVRINRYVIFQTTKHVMSELVSAHWELVTDPEISGPVGANLLVNLLGNSLCIFKVVISVVIFHGKQS